MMTSTRFIRSVPSSRFIPFVHAFNKFAAVFVNFWKLFNWRSSRVHEIRIWVRYTLMNECKLRWRRMSVSNWFTNLISAEFSLRRRQRTANVVADQNCEMVDDSSRCRDVVTFIMVQRRTSLPLESPSPAPTQKNKFRIPILVLSSSNTSVAREGRASGKYYRKREFNRLFGLFFPSYTTDFHCNKNDEQIFDWIHSENSNIMRLCKFEARVTLITPLQHQTSGLITVKPPCSGHRWGQKNCPL